MVITAGRATFAVLLAGMTTAAHATPVACRERLLPLSFREATGKRPIVAKDLIELRDFGRIDNPPAGPPIFALSPDGRRAAIGIRRADIQSNSYCFGIALIALDGSKTVSLVDVGGELISSTNDIRGVPAIPSGVPVALAPIWSSDGKSLFYLRRDQGLTRVWQAKLDSSAGQPLTKLKSDALSIQLARDGRTLLVATRPSLDAASVDIGREGRRGFHFDDRFWTLSEAKPRPALPLPEQITAIDPSTGAERVLPAREVESWRPAKDAFRPEYAILFARSPSGNRAWTATDDPLAFFASAKLHVEVGGVERNCPTEICGRRIVSLWWDGATDLYFMRGGGPEDAGRFRLFRWDLSKAAGPRLLFETGDWLMGCVPWMSAILCARETASEPRTLVLIDPIDGKIATLFDPNPELAGIRLGRVQRLAWSNTRGMRTYGDLVLPPDHRPGQRHPLIVVQYQSRGFLRGGTGDDYPIYLLAQRGFAVLSFQRPGSLPGSEKVHDLNALQRINIDNWAERRAIFSALDAGVDAAVAGGAVDSSQIGITGLSDGATTTEFALINSSRFKAAAISSCCDEPSGSFTVGPAYRNAVLAWGYPKHGLDSASFWRPLSLSTNAPTMRTPLLMQLPDAEYRWALESISALEQHDAPVDAYIFPDEYHVKSQPLHRLAIYERSVGWFEYWLIGRVTDRSRMTSEISRWEAMRHSLRRE